MAGTRKKKTQTKSKKAAKPSQVSQVMAFIRSEQGRKSFGLLLIAISLFLLIAFVSHFFVGHRDQSLVAGGVTERPANWLGAIGAWAAQSFISRGFGFMALLIPLYSGLLGLALLENNYFKLWWRLMKYVLFGLFWGSVFLGFVYYLAAGTGGDLGGGFGWYLNNSLYNQIGVVGVGLVLAISLAIFLVLNFNTDFPVSRWLSAVAPTRGQTQAIDADEQMEGESGDTEEKEQEETDENDPDYDFVLSVRKDENEQKAAQEAASEENFQKEPQEKIVAEKTAVSEEKTEKDPLKLEVTLTEEEQARVDQSLKGQTLDLSTDIPKKQESTHTGGGLELTIEERHEEKEVTPVPLDNGDNIQKVGDDKYEKIVQEQDEEKLDDEEDVGDWDEFDPTKELSSYQYPPIDILEARDSAKSREVNRSELEENKNKIVETLSNYKIEITSIKATIGPTVTLYEIVPAPGVRISKIRNLEDDIALSLAALGIRIIAPIPGRGTIGIEIPNSNPEIVSMRSTIATEKFRDTKAELPLCLGKTISNEVFIADLAKMPHLLIAGATGQGKSVGINGIISSLLYKKHPAYVKFVLIDPKKVELSLYSALENHFLAKLDSQESPIITDTKQVIHVLNSLCHEMDERYALLQRAKVRNLREYNTKFTNRRLNPKKGHRFMPYIVLIIDEFADLMMTAGKEIEQPIARLAQLARAIGIHLVLATQRPSVNVITGIIKANFPARISYRVTSKVDSRTILDTGGADQLIGRGDMLLSTGSEVVRIQNSFIDTPEVDKLVDFIAEQRGYSEAYILPEVPTEGDENDAEGLDDEERDDLFEDAARLVVRHQQGSTSLIQRRLKLGYNRAGRIIDQLERAGIVGPFSGSKARDVLVPDEYSLEQFLRDME